MRSNPILVGHRQPRLHIWIWAWVQCVGWGTTCASAPNVHTCGQSFSDFTPRCLQGVHITIKINTETNGFNIWRQLLLLTPNFMDKCTLQALISPRCLTLVWALILSLTLSYKGKCVQQNVVLPGRINTLNILYHGVPGSMIHQNTYVFVRTVV